MWGSYKKSGIELGMKRVRSGNACASKLVVPTVVVSTVAEAGQTVVKGSYGTLPTNLATVSLKRFEQSNFVEICIEHSR
jgi:hypothetical protein